MPTETTADRAQATLLDPVARLFAAWGLRAGGTARGWTVVRIERSPAADAAIVAFRRGTDEIAFRLQRASSGPRFARVGDIDLSHGRVEGSLEPESRALAGALATWLSLHDRGSGLLPLLATAPAATAQAYEAGEAPPLDPAKRTPADRPFMQFDTIDLADVSRFPDAVREMYLGKLGGLVIRGVYSKEDMARITSIMEKGEVNFPRTSFPPRFKAHFYGRCLDGSDPLLDEYLTDADRFRQETLSVFSGTVPYETRMEQMFSSLSGGRPVQVPRFTDGRAYTAGTVRILLKDGQIGTHCGNEASGRPAYTHLNTVIDRGDQISFFLTLQEPEAGGELIVYSLKWFDIDPSRIVDGRSHVDDLLRDAEWMAVSPTAGDLLIFDGGRYFHRVAKVQGERMRWTLGGFMMFDASGEQLLYWS